MADIFQIVKYEGDNTTFVWKSPIEDFNTGTQLIVHESQEAIFFMNGQALDLFGPGRHTLETQNIPLVRGFFNRKTDDQTPFHCEIYFVNKTEQMAIKWGTDSQVVYNEPTRNFPLKIGASGEMTLRVENSRKLLVKIVGTEHSLAQSGMVQMFRAFLMAKVKPYLAQTMQRGEFDIFEVDSHMDELSQVLHKQLTPDFAEYGVSLEHFFVTTIVKPDGDKFYEGLKDFRYRKSINIDEAKLRQEEELIEQDTKDERMIRESKALATKRAQEGYTYQNERGFDVAERVAQNEAVGGIANAGIGLGMMGGMAGGIGAMVAGITTDALNPITGQQGAAAGAANQTPGFGVGVATPATGATPGTSAGDDMAAFKQKLEKIKMMREMGMLSDAEFEAQKNALLSAL